MMKDAQTKSTNGEYTRRKHAMPEGLKILFEKKL